MIKLNPVPKPQKHPATYQDVIDADPKLVAQIINGTLHTHPRPAFPHAVASSGLGIEIGSPFFRDKGGPGGWWILFEQEVHLGGDVIVPDISGWRRETMPEPPETPFVAIAPDWACEVLSPSTRQIDLGPKRNIYAREGVGYLWFVDPDGRTLEAFELKDGKWVL
uniref:Uma2 family endonuclease n=1 Tax=Ruegeria sp. TaxID=1879320 RepID=UPI003B00EA70